MEGYTPTELMKKVPGLGSGNFWYWVKAVARLDPIGTRQVNRRISDVYAPDSVKKILSAMGRNKARAKKAKRATRCVQS